ncbi:FMN-dependent NADH-azoreductase [Colwellia ponticola]|uniref:FMN dependent NADH:quinone oxidoreductase n=1 Tax=Colwellia ponticola TaxID=2304625 RepID=A0A8H2JJN3_9GAMM|nr:NAD(P)H-dependent oxidoreductase [Colwellia ponticola]TMM42001.1 ACP phosphodiesterase [Colwellia ponticola]
MNILHINSSTRIEESNTRTIGKFLTDSLAGDVVHRDLAFNPLPPISAEELVAVHGSKASDDDAITAQLKLSNTLIAELQQADVLVIGAPMYNFGVPATLKQWIDAVCRAGVSFQYTNEGPVGLLDIKTAFIITGTGGTPIGSNIDFTSDYLEHICRFIGVKEIVHIEASGSKGSPATLLASAKQKIAAVLDNAELFS